MVKEKSKSSLNKNLNKSLKWWERANKKTEELSRWISLYEAVNLIADKCEEKGMNFNTIQLSPLEIKTYMDSTVDIYHKKLLNQLYGINIIYSENDDLNKF